MYEYIQAKSNRITLILFTEDPHMYHDASGMTFFAHICVTDSEGVQSYSNNSLMFKISPKLSLILMNPHMLLQRRRILEHLIAMRTLNRISLMRMHMFAKTIKRNQLPTNGAFLLVPSRLMFPNPVMSQTGRIFKIRSTILAQISPHSSMHTLQMKAQFCLKSKLLRAFRTLKNLLQSHVSRLHMLIQSSLMFKLLTTIFAQLPINIVAMFLLMLSLLPLRIQHQIAILANQFPDTNHIVILL